MIGKNVALPSAATPSSNVETVTSRCTKRNYDLKRKRRSELHGGNSDALLGARHDARGEVNVARQLIGKMAEVSTATDRHGDDISTSAIESTSRTVHSGRSLDDSVLSLKSKRTFQLISKKNSQRTKAWLRVTPTVEGARLEAVSLLCFRFEQATGKYFGPCWANKFEEFLLCHDQSDDPLLPNDKDATSFLRSRLLAARVPKHIIDKTVLTLLTCLRHARNRILTEAGPSKSAEKRQQVTVSFFENSMHEPRVRMCLGGARVEIRAEYYEKLRHLFAMRSESSLPLSSDDISVFQSATFSMLCRYTAAQGGMHRMSGGHHTALHAAVFDVLQHGLDVEAECFASPLNCHFHEYCSLFPDTDTTFGSRGSFFSFFPAEGSFECNPPFEEGIVLRCAEHVLLLLSRAEELKTALSFVVITPYWPGRLAWETVASSQNTSHVERIRRNEHSFLDGAQHTKRKRYRFASSDTTVCFLQSSVGKKRFAVTANLLRSLKVAFMPPS